MSPLQNAGIERPERMFSVELVVFGTTTRDAERRTVKVWAQTSKGARRICKSHFKRSEIRSARILHEPEYAGSMSLFVPLCS